MHSRVDRGLQGTNRLWLLILVSRKSKEGREHQMKRAEMLAALG